MGNGQATVTATVGGISAQCAVAAAKHTPAGEGTKGVLFDEFTCATAVRPTVSTTIAFIRPWTWTP